MLRTTAGRVLEEIVADIYLMGAKPVGEYEAERVEGCIKDLNLDRTVALDVLKDVTKQRWVQDGGEVLVGAGVLVGVGGCLSYVHFFLGGYKKTHMTVFYEPCSNTGDTITWRVKGLRPRQCSVNSR